MTREEILVRLRENEASCEIEVWLMPRCSALGSRGDQRPDSDTDILIEFDPVAVVTVFDYAGLKDFIAELLDGRVDVVNLDGLKPYIKPAAASGAIYAFWARTCSEAAPR